MKLLFIASSCATVFLIFKKFRATYDGNHDTFRAGMTVLLHPSSADCASEFVLVPSLLLALIWNYQLTVLEVLSITKCILQRLTQVAQVLWAFSIYLESVAILPQLFMVSKTGEAENITSHYLFALGYVALSFLTCHYLRSYRALYILNWIYRYYEDGHIDYIAVVAGVVQTVLYCDFFYLYVTKGNFNPIYSCSNGLYKVLHGKKLLQLP